MGRITLSLPDETLRLLEVGRGDLTVSAYVNLLLKRALGVRRGQPDLPAAPSTGHRRDDGVGTRTRLYTQKPRHG